MTNIPATVDFDVKIFFENDIASTSVQLKRPFKTRLLWLNERAMEMDPNFLTVSENLKAYKELLLQLCGFVVSENSFSETLGWADRYGGAGNGTCGGSGRAAFVNGYHIKGIGRTPLLGLEMDPSHSTGHVSLEEAIRESIYGEVMSRFPWSTVPVLAIVDTGVTRRNAYQELEQEVLVVRPGFLRCGHFDRAERPILVASGQGAKDAKRVSYIIRTAQETSKCNDLGDLFVQFWMRWADQIAFGLIHRISQFNYSSSNICLDGRLLDFGAARSIFFHTDIGLEGGLAPTSSDFDTLMRAMFSTIESISRYGLDISIPSNVISRIKESYNRTFALNLLKCTGIDQKSMQKMCKPEIFGKIVELISADSEVKNLLRRGLCGIGLYNIPRNGADLIDVKNKNYTDNFQDAINCIVNKLGFQEIDIDSNNRMEFISLQELRELDRSNLQSEIVHRFTLDDADSPDIIDDISAFITSKTNAWNKWPAAITEANF